jgi:hypothetical protein
MSRAETAKFPERVLGSVGGETSAVYLPVRDAGVALKTHDLILSARSASLWGKLSLRLSRGHPDILQWCGLHRRTEIFQCSVSDA